MKGFSLNTDQIIDLLEITPPFLMIDYIKKIKPGEMAHSFKKLSQDEWFFQCHLKKDGVMPGVLQIEAMLQTLVLTLYTMEGHKAVCGQIMMAMDIQGVKEIVMRVIQLYSQVQPWMLQITNVCMMVMVMAMATHLLHPHTM